ncbi:hypothetical protein ThrDRAFT_03386 [Frankia casuarinae]|jgi:YVTN family beta-propeller protein|uniref:YncE family protein n=2 Tax=Frankia TaxID=1854 RepID=Q2J9V0_FRACC|nr:MULTISPECIES: hypothetical protein [Frankia]KEZ34986.1 hypothetical protein CEDDRAFT_03663 [Frankia sp. CeD]ABD11942.1 conserved hypothetical protein [Frankia casuarinae]ETA00206.1 hypothetical protein CcI6DRAFT_04397 [Frankia sp. CcI6]EYT90982.1 hypothetical protein ThrDRAFT_03386 [Frankia casuarinae]KDA41549.1 hypothetical protein BMG523Draft_03617 [Frankia sp. BMG5.23]
MTIHAYVASIRTGQVLVVDPLAGVVSAAIGVGVLPFGVAVAPDGSRVYVTNFGGNDVSVVDTATGAVTG